jgi:hypothetical protein
VARENAAARAISAEESIRWLADASDVGQTTGFDASGWPASVWLLHAMYEAPSRSGELTHDDVRRLELAAGLVEHWFAYRSWPSNVLPPGEGSLDRE